MIGCFCRTMNLINRYFYSDEAKISHKIGRLGSGDREIRWTAEVPENTILWHSVKKTCLGNTVTKTKIWHTNETFQKQNTDERLKMIFENCERPWLWIGCGETDYTEQVDQYIVPGNRVTLELLGILFPDETEWSYLCPKTLEKLDFPVDGIQIE